MIEPQNLVVAVYCNAEAAENFSENEWDLLIRQARSSNMLARICVRLEERQMLDEIPQQVKSHLTSAKIAANALQRSIQWEVYCICQALAATDIPIILLKGAAYSLANLPAKLGRQFEDVDIMVPKVDLDTVERKLMLHGWVTTHTNSYDQRYYRQWMHELPPMRHVKRRSSLDVHHTILPETARWHPDPHKLLASAEVLDRQKNLYILSKPDLVLHSATHLFSEGELNNGLRDLTDLDLLLREFGKEPQFWNILLRRAEEMDLQRPLYFALRYVQRFLGTPVPMGISKQSAIGSPGKLHMVFVDWLFGHGLQPDHASCRSSLTGIARWILYMRSHYLRMPLHFLIPHLVRKAIRREEDR